MTDIVTTDPIIQAMAEAIKPILYPTEWSEKPTIVELEAILNTQEAIQMQINPDGSVTTSKEVEARVNAIAQAALAVAQPMIEKPLRHEIARLKAVIESFGGNKERLIEEFYEQDCVMCGFNGRRIDEYVEQALQEKAG